MKKTFSLFFLLAVFASPLFFSCATKAQAETEESTAAPEDTQALFDETDLQAEDTTLEEPEEFEEPLVRDLDLPPEAIEKSTEDIKSPETAQKPEKEEPVEIKDELEILSTQTPPAAQSEAENSDYTFEGSDDSQINYVKIGEEKGTSQVEASENTQASESNEAYTQSPNSAPDLLSDSDFTGGEIEQQNTKTADTESNSDTANNTEEQNLSNYSGGITGSLINQEEEAAATEQTEPEEETKTEPEKQIITPSRSVTLKKGESLKIVYPGSGWIYMGSLSEYNNLASRGRKLGSTDTTYTLYAKEAGTQIQHFYKADAITGNYIDDYIEVTVLNEKGSAKTIVTAPDYAAIVPKQPETPASAAVKANPEADYIIQKEEQSETSKQKAEGQTVPEIQVETKNEEQTENSEAPFEQSEDDALWVIDEEETNNPEIDTKSILEQAKNLYNQKEYSEAEKLLKDFFEYATDGRDEALYLKGQILESDSPIRDIKEAIATYETLTQNYPASRFWDSANKRITYLKRFYIEVR